MKPTKKLGIWMDHSIAHLMEFTSNPFEIKSIESHLIRPKEMDALVKTEQWIHSKEQQQLSHYYRKLGLAIKDYKRVLLFGPTNAKFELFDVLSEDEGFVHIKIEIKETDKMTENQKNAFVKSYFSKA
jgi:hypothetical protein